MKIIEENANRLVMQDRDLLMKLWCIMVPIFCTATLIVLLSNYTPKLEIGVILCSVFIVIGLFGLVFMQKQLTYEFDRAMDRVCILYPKNFATMYEAETFLISEIKCIVKKLAIESSGRDNPNASKALYVASGFEFALKSGKKIHCGLYSSDHNEITDIINNITRFIQVSVQEENEETDVLIL